MPVQDDERERELVRMFNLVWDPSHQRAGVDAVLRIHASDHQIELEVEVKSTTGTTVSTARDVGMEHIAKWRRKLFVIGFYSREARRPELQRTLCLTPIDMEPWIATIEEKILIDFRIAKLASARIGLDDLYELISEKPTYSIADAVKIHKRQWTAEQYQQAADITRNGKKLLSQSRMLDILRLRAQYIAERGATLNNPHVTKVFLDTFAGTNREIVGSNWAVAIREIANRFIAEYPNHPSIKN